MRSGPRVQAPRAFSDVPAREWGFTLRSTTPEPHVPPADDAPTPDPGSRIDATHATSADDVGATPLGAGSARTTPTPTPGARTRARFQPGAMIGDRHRVVTFLGRGGMGEVYLAEDLRLDQQVALKFLPPEAADNPARRERFNNEVRLARQVSHRHVCRVYDIGEASTPEGPLTFLSMEYVDGEDLASLLRRIGRLPRDKAIAIARQLCAGLHAAHAAGVLHRDLKPANVMLDGRGDARITDFGIAGLAESLGEGDARAGTPAYMAPEQLRGEGVSVRSDVYALGLVLYEIFTGEPAHRGETIDALRTQKESLSHSAPSSIVHDMDPVVERVIARCLAPDPKDRPASALEVAAALPGGDPLAAALAAGETPSPALVAASGGEGTMRPGVAIACAALAALLAVACVWLNTPLKRWAMIEEYKAPAVVVERAREALRLAGLETTSPNERMGIETDHALVGHMLQGVSDRDDRIRMQRRSNPSTILFVWRGSDVPIVTSHNDVFVSPLSSFDPPMALTGDRTLQFDMDGSLRSLRAFTVWGTVADEPTHEPDWGALFALCGLDFDAYAPAAPTLIAAVSADARLAWAPARSEGVV